MNGKAHSHVSDTDLTGHTVLATVTNYGVEQDELIVPVEHLHSRGAEVTIAAASNDTIITLVGDPSPMHVGMDLGRSGRRQKGPPPAPQPRDRVGGAVDLRPVPQRLGDLGDR